MEYIQMIEKAANLYKAVDTVAESQYFWGYLIAICDMSGNSPTDVYLQVYEMANLK